MKINPSFRNQHVPMDTVRAAKISNVCLGCGVGLPHHRAKRCPACGHAHKQEIYQKIKAKMILDARLRRRAAKAKIIARHLGVYFKTHRQQLFAAVAALEEHAEMKVVQAGRRKGRKLGN